MQPIIPDNLKCGSRQKTSQDVLLEGMRFSRKFPLRPALLLVALLTGLCVSRDSGLAQADPPEQQLDSGAILRHLNAVINWYRQMSSRVQFTGEPSDAIYASNAQSLAGKAVQLAFQSAKAEAALLPGSPAPASGGSSAGSSAQSIEKRLNDVTAHISELQSQIAGLNGSIAKAPKRERQNLIAQRETLAGELDLNKAMQQVMEQVVKSSDINGETGAGGLLSSINQLERTVPELSGGGQPSPKAANKQASQSEATGLFGQAELLYEQLESVRQIGQLIDQVGRVQSAAAALRTPLQATLRATLEQGQHIAAQAGQGQTATPSPQSPAPAQPLATRQQLDALAARFQQIANAAIPLREEVMVLDQSRFNLEQWRDSIKLESGRDLRSVLVHVVGIAIAICIVLVLSEIWRRVTFRYVHDIRRRRQFLILRRIVVGFCMGLVLILGFVSEFSSLATFAGFITAGLAVGLQTVLLSVAAYFFLVGRWGIRVGDRISVGGVTGDVVDISLVRLYLMELAGTGVDLYQTGRIVVFANSILFQPTTPLFKQLPGTEYAWHELVVNLQAGGDYKLAEEKILQAVRSIHEQYRDYFTRQLGSAERRIDIQIKLPEPHAQLQSSDSGLESVVRYPVGLDRVAEVDNQIIRKLLELIQQQPGLKEAISGFPKIRAAVKG